MNKPPTTPLKATIVISTKNRSEELRVALNSCLRQIGSVEILVVNDGSTDGTAELLRKEFPTVRSIHHAVSTGLVVARNEAAKIADCDIIISIDDDAELTSSEIISHILTEFEDERVGAVAIPYMDVNRDRVERQRATDQQNTYVTDQFIGTAHAVRRDLFLRLGGYREFLFHQGEESDFCIRMLEAGYFVKLGTSSRIDHFESPRRDTRRMDIYGRRNDVLFGILNVPLLYLAPHLLTVIIRGLVFGLRVRRPLRMLQGTLFGLLSSIRYVRHRRPVSRRNYQLFRQLQRLRSIDIRKLS